MSAQAAGMDKQRAAMARRIAVAVSTAPVLLLIMAIVTVALIGDDGSAARAQGIQASSSASISITGLEPTIPLNGSDRYTVRASGLGSLSHYYSASVSASGALSCSSGDSYIGSPSSHSFTAQGCRVGTGSINASLTFHSPDYEGEDYVVDSDSQSVTVRAPEPTATNTPIPTNTPTPTPTSTPTPTPTPTNTPTPVPLEPPKKVDDLRVVHAPQYGSYVVHVSWNRVDGAVRYEVQTSRGASRVWRNTLPYRPDPEEHAEQATTSRRGDVYATVCGEENRFRVAAHGDGYTVAATRGRWSDIKAVKLPCPTPPTPIPPTPTNTPTPTPTPTSTPTTTPTPTNTPTATPTPTYTPIPTPAPTPDPPSTPEPGCIRPLSNHEFRSTPQPTPTAQSDIDLVPYTEPKTTSWQGDWADGCLSQWQRYNSRPLPGVYYTMDLTQDSHVTIDLAAESKQLDAFLVLRKNAPSYSGKPWRFNDDNEESTASNDSRLSFKLAKGSYTIEATMQKPVPANLAVANNLPFTLSVLVAEPFPQLGYQRDFTIMYYLDKTPEPDVRANTVGPDPYEIALLHSEIPHAAAMWNAALGSPWPDILICQRGDAIQSIPPQQCADRNTDGNAIPIDIVSGLDRRLFCSDTTACVYPGLAGVISHVFTPLSQLSFAPSLVIFESPAFYHTATDPTERLVKWAASTALHNHYEMLGDGTIVRLRYARGIIAHEFGHTAGLTDLYEEEYGNKYDGYLMNDKYDIQAIPQEDLEYVKQVYRTEHGARPH